MNVIANVVFWVDMLRLMCLNCRSIVNYEALLELFLLTALYL